MPTLRSALVALALFAVPASAQTGRYAVSGANPGGTGRYGGTVAVSPQGEALRVLWDTGGPSVEGIGVVVNDVLAVAYGGACGVVAYAPADDGSGLYEAVWATMGGSRLGTEAARPQGGEGRYAVAGTNPGSAGVYTGTLAMEPAGNATRIRWTVGGSAYDGIGLTVDGVLGIAYGAPSCSVAVYRVAGGTLDGVWTTPGAGGIGTEVATLQ